MSFYADQQQKQPIATVDGKTRATTGVLQNKALYNNCIGINFIQQHRSVDPYFQEILNVLRYYKPSMRNLSTLYGTGVLSSSTPSKAELLRVLQTHPDGMILTVSRSAAAIINAIAVTNLFSDMHLFGEVHFDNGQTLQPTYVGIRIIITQNRDSSMLSTDNIGQ